MPYSTTDEKEIFFATSLANPRVLSEVRGHLAQIEWLSPLSKRIAEYFSNLSDGQAYNKTVLHSHLTHEFLDVEILQVLSKCLDHRVTYEGDPSGIQTNDILREFQRFYNRKVTTKLIQDFQHDPERLVDEIEKLQRLKFATLPLDILGELDVDKVIEEDLGNIRYIPSSFPCVRESCAPFDGYSTGQVIMVCAAPGNGKTLFMGHEIVSMMKANLNIEKEEEKFKVYWISLGDMNRLDFIIRLTAIYLEKSFNLIKLSPKLYFNEEVREALKYVKISVVPAAYIDIYGVRTFIENTVVTPDFDPQIIVIDYDANLLSNREMMYHASEEIYNVASTISRPFNKAGRLVFVASQPKIEYWNQCPMPKEAAAESSRKQAIIDFMITIARDPNAAKGTRVGKMLIAKNRRGADGCIGLYRMQDGLFYDIDENVYATSLESSSASSGSTTRRNYSGGGGGRRQANQERYGGP